MDIAYNHGGSELIDTIQPLWEQLNQHHEQISLYFKGEFYTNTFEQRKAKLSQKYGQGQLRFDLAYYKDDLVGYCISGIGENGIGEIESIYIIKEFRGQYVGEVLMQHALDWLDEQGVTSKMIDVAVGNERAFKFYARFGFFPRVTRLKQKDTDTP
jgi:ribosomal protein S18 acetylase RimI-like enzyme